MGSEPRHLTRDDIDEGTRRIVTEAFDCVGVDTATFVGRERFRANLAFLQSLREQHEDRGREFRRGLFQNTGNLVALGVLSLALAGGGYLVGHGFPFKYTLVDWRNDLQDAFLSCLDFTRIEEGGYTCDSRDSGNWSSGLVGKGRLIGSNMGVSAPTLISWMGRDSAMPVTAETMRSLSESVYQAIARARYWRSLSCDGLAPVVALMVFDFGWNVGVSVSARVLQKTIGLEPALVDGDLGPKTLSAATKLSWSVLLTRLDPESIKTLQALCGVTPDGVAGTVTLRALSSQPSLLHVGVALALGMSQTAFYEALPNFDLYGKGWLARTSRRVSAATQLASSASLAS